MRIAISGAGIAGPTLAYWLRKGGHDVLLIEEAPQLRRGGYLVDFWGVGYDVADKMGLVPQIRELGYQVQEVRFVDSRSGTIGGFSTDVFARATNGRFTSLRRSDLSAVIYGALDTAVETVFGDSIVDIEDRGASVRIRFERAASRDVDLVVGADGVHSRVRQLVFGPEAQFEVALRYYVAAFEVDGYRPRDPLVYVTHGTPGRQVSRFSLRDDKTLFLLVFRDDYLPGPLTSDCARQAMLRTVFADVGWECPRILDTMDSVSDLYFDRVSQIRMDRWARGRAALVGDAAACVSLLAGEGTGLAMAEAYVMAGELHASPDDHAGAFTRYQNRLTTLLARKQQAAARFASSFAPATARGLAFRNTVSRLLRFGFIAEFVLGRDLRDPITLPRYDF
jgi:2-polyprenyl-6-methoxyphenol hydroxylase-like FAD-dependent oxidoreductase